MMTKIMKEKVTQKFNAITHSFPMMIFSMTQIWMMMIRNGLISSGDDNMATPTRPLAVRTRAETRSRRRLKVMLSLTVQLA